MKFFEKLSGFFNKNLFNVKWRCISCNREIFDGEYFCQECQDELPLLEGKICEHCGRALKRAQNYCTTCKGKLTSIDKARSVYSYEKPINTLVKKMKYYNGRFLAQAFATELSNVYFKNYFNADVVVFVPATKKSLKKRGFNQSELLAKQFCELTGLPLVDCLEKVKETDRQALLDKTSRQKNLKGAFNVKDKIAVKNKKVVIVDDVSTTGSTAENIASVLKKAKAERVFLLTVASVAPKDGY